MNSVRAQATYAPRGLILDRNGVVLVENYPTYILTVTPYELDNKEAQFQIISDITDISIDELSRRYKKYNQGRFLPTVIAKNLTFAEISQIEERPFFNLRYLSKCKICLLYTSPSPRDATLSRMPSSA